MSLPVPRSFQQFLKAMIQTYVFKSGVTDINKGSANRSLIEAAALSDYKIQGDIMSALASVDIDRATNADLDRIGFSKGVSRTQARESNGVITIYQKSLIKIATKVYQGTAAPPAGSVTLNIADAANLPAAGSIYIGRGTNNLEGPISYTSITSLGSYYQLALSSPTTKNHNTGEAVVLAQGGNRVIPAGSSVQTKSTLTSESVTFRTINSVTLLDGEVEIKDVPVICTKIGTAGNVSSQSIVEFTSEPFPNAAAINPLAFVSGRDIMADADYRELIKKTEQSRVKGTDLAIIQASIGVQSTDDNKTVTSAEIRKPASRTEPSILFIDDSTGYQPIFSGQGFEQIIDDANGGEKFLQLQKEDLTKASIVCSLEAPFAVTGGMTLSVKIGGLLSEHMFATADFATDGSADTFEVVNSINNNPNLTFSARAYNNSKQFVIFAKAFSSEDIQVSTPSSGVDANDYFGFAKNITYTLRLYKNDNLLYKDGITPTIYSNAQNVWNNSITDGSTLKVKVDQTGTQAITINNVDFVPYGYATVNKDNSLASWASVLNNKLAGVTVTVEGNKLKMVSNKGANSSARLEITTDNVANSLSIGDNMFEQQAVTGLTSDYALNQSTGQIQLASPAVADDVFTAGSKFTRGFIDSSIFSSGSVTLGSYPIPKLYVIVDAAAQKRNVSLSSSVTVTITNPSAGIGRYTFSVSGVISGVQKDDLVVITDDAALNPGNIGSFRVSAVDGAGTWFEVANTIATPEGPIALTGANDFTFINSPNGEVQSVNLPVGLQTLTALANTIKTLQGLTAEVVSGKKIRISTLSFDNASGSIYLAAQNINASTLGFTVGTYDSSEISHTAFNDSQSDLTFTEFYHDKFTVGDGSSPYDTVQTLQSILAFGYNQNNKISFLNPYGVNISSNRKLSADTISVNGTNLLLRSSAKLHEIIADDRYYLSVPFNFNALDNMVVILDNDTVNKTFNIKMGRKAKVYSSPNASTLIAYDTDFSPTANFPSGFGNNFDFKDFKVHLKARQIFDPANANNKMMVRSASYGPTGNKTNVGIYYPQTESSAVSHAVTVNDVTEFKIILASGALRTGGTWDATTQFDVTAHPASIYRYTWNSFGTAPNFLTAAIVVGDIVNISSASTFNSGNTGIFKIIAITNNYFEVYNYGSALAENNKTLNTVSSLKFFPLDDVSNTASLVETYINGNAEASEYITIAQMETGAGIINSSTLDDSSGSDVSLSLIDGENWVSSSNIGTTITPVNQFTLKVPLTIFAADLLNEEFYLIPTRSEQLNRFFNKFAVTGLSSLGNISLSEDAKSLQIYSTLFGSSGKVFVTGGSGNSTNGAVVDSAAVVNTDYIKFAISKASATGLHAGQWVKVANTDTIARDTKFKATTQMDWDTTAPVVDQSTITLTNSDSSNVYQNGYFWTKKYHRADSTTKVRLEKQGKFIALSWTGTGTQPKFTESLNISNVARTSGVSTITTSVSHGIPVTQSMEITVNNCSNSSFDGIYRATATSTTQLQFRQDSLSNVVSGAATGNIFKKVRKTDRVVLGTDFNVANRGEYSIVGVYSNTTIYFENPNAIEEDVTLSSNANITIYDYDSVRAGDVFSVGSSVLDAVSPYESHMGSFVVSSLTANENELVIACSLGQDVTGVTLGSDFNNVRVIEETPFNMYGKIANIGLSPANINNTDVVLEGIELPSKITPSAGTSISAVSKLGFSTDVNTGEDSYKYYGGLISAVGQKIRGKSSDPITYPGVAAAGSYIIPDAALPKRIQLSIVIRNRTGTPFNVVKSRVQSSVAAYVNSVGVGRSVIFSEIVVSAQSIDGVQAVAISSPTYNASNDQIISQPDEKPLIFNIDTDIIVSQAT